jgi:hypothetical protein
MGTFIAASPHAEVGALPAAEGVTVAVAMFRRGRCRPAVHRHQQE